jgi:hypothetical protein
VYLLHCKWRCNILCSKHDIDMWMNEWNRNALFLSWNGRNRYLHSTLLKIWNFFHSWEKFSVFPLVPLVKRRNFSHSWKKSQIFIRDSCKNLLVFLAFVGQVLFALLLHTCGPENYFTLLWCFIWIVNKKTCIYTPANKVWGVYRNHPVRPSMYLVSATSPKPLIGFLWNFIHL